MVRSKYQKVFDNIVTHGVLGFFSIFMLFPVIYSLMTSLKNKGDVLTLPPTFFPPEWTLEGYQIVLKSDLIRYYLPNSAINSFVAAIITVVFATLASYVFSRFKFRGSRLLELSILGLFMIPGLTNLVSYYRLATDLGLLNTHTVMIMVYTAAELPFAIWILRAFFDAIPIELEEAAQIDGCTSLQILWNVTLPLAIPGLFTAFLLIMVYLWNEFLFAVVLLSNNSARTAPVGLYEFQTTFDIAYHALNAASIVILLPMVILFILGRKVFFSAMMEGALKG
ncbi:MAG: carbohydrate ABC transporter permease [Anaerolineaceae bacterium]|nr:carbohydrate ABC transporter permease [Anaerolineaceae bacterium]